MARGWRYTEFSLSSALLPHILACALCYCSFLFVVFVFMLSLKLVNVPLIFPCPPDHVPDWQPRLLLGMVEAWLRLDRLM